MRCLEDIIIGNLKTVLKTRFDDWIDGNKQLKLTYIQKKKLKDKFFSILWHSHPPRNKVGDYDCVGLPFPRLPKKEKEDSSKSSS